MCGRILCQGHKILWSLCEYTHPRILWVPLTGRPLITHAAGCSGGTGRYDLSRINAVTNFCVSVTCANSCACAVTIDCSAVPIVFMVAVCCLRSHFSSNHSTITAMISAICSVTYCSNHIVSCVTPTSLIFASNFKFFNGKDTLFECAISDHYRHFIDNHIRNDVATRWERDNG